MRTFGVVGPREWCDSSRGNNFLPTFHYSTPTRGPRGTYYGDLLFHSSVGLRSSLDLHHPTPKQTRPSDHSSGLDSRVYREWSLPRVCVPTKLTLFPPTDQMVGHGNRKDILYLGPYPLLETSVSGSCTRLLLRSGPVPE